MKPAVRKEAFPLAPLQAWAWAVPLALWAALLLVAFLFGSHEQSPTNPVPWWVVVVFGTALPSAGMVSALAHREIHIEGDKLVVSGALFFAKKLQVDQLLLDQARILSLEEHTEYAPRLQLFAVGLPGFKVGHYLLRNRKRAFCLLTDRKRVLLIPRRDGRLLLLSPERPQALLDALAAHVATVAPGPMQAALP